MPPILPSCRTMCSYHNPNLEPCVSGSATRAAWISQPPSLPSFLPVRVQSRTAQRWGDFQRNASSGDAVFARTSSRARTQTWTPRPHGVACVARCCPRFSQAQEKTCLSGHAAAAVTLLPVLQQTFLKIITRKSVLQSSNAKHGVVST